MKVGGRSVDNSTSQMLIPTPDRRKRRMRKKMKKGMKRTKKEV